jgi:hypothetical protein
VPSLFFLRFKIWQRMASPRIWWSNFDTKEGNWFISPLYVFQDWFLYLWWIKPLRIAPWCSPKIWTHKYKANQRHDCNCHYFSHLVIEIFLRTHNAIT